MSQAKIRILKTIDGKNLKKEDDLDVSVRDVMLNSLLANFPDEQGLAGEEKVKRYILATKIHNDSNPDLSIEELSLIKGLVGKMYSALIVGQMWEILEGKDGETNQKSKNGKKQSASPNGTQTH